MIKNLPGAAWSFSEKQVEEVKNSNGILNCDIEISKHCNLKCVFCYSESGPTMRDELSIKEIFTTILSAKAMGAKTITLTGGEPLLRPDFFEISQFINDNEMRCLFFTNGTFITPAIAKKLFQLEALPCVSLESTNPITHDKMVGVHGALEKTITGIKNLVNAGYSKSLPLTINAVVSSLNYDELPDLWEWAKINNIEPFLLRLISSGRGRQINDLQVTPEMMKRLVKTIATKEGFQSNIPFFGNSGCKKHGISCYVDAHGYVKPCSGLDITCGNIRHKGLVDILNNSPIFSLMKNIENNIQGACKECDHHGVCYGCRAITYSLTGDLVGADPLCWVANNLNIT